MTTDTDVSLIKPRRLDLKVGGNAAAVAALNDQDSFATTLFILAVDAFPPDPEKGEKQSPLLEWTPTTIKMEMNQHYGVQLSQLALDKIMAAILIRTTDLFFRDPFYFIEMCNVLSGDNFEPDEFDPADSIECAWGVTEGLLLNPPDEEDPEPFSDEVRAYIGFVLREEGFTSPPGILKIALDADFSPQVAATFADDPELFQGIYQAQQGKTDEVESIMKSQLTELAEQLQRLTLQNGSTAGLIQRLRQSLQLQD